MTRKITPTNKIEIKKEPEVITDPFRSKGVWTGEPPYQEPKEPEGNPITKIGIKQGVKNG